MRWPALVQNCSIRSLNAYGVGARLVRESFLPTRVPYVELTGRAGDLYLFNSEHVHETLFALTWSRRASERGWSRDASSDDEFDADAATREAKKLRVAELRAALEAAGADSKGLKPALVERLVGVRRRAAASGPTLSPVAFSETDDDPPPRASPAKRVWGLRRRFSPRKLRTRRPRAAALSPEEPSQ